MKMEAEIGVLLPQAKHRSYQKLEEAKKDLPPLKLWREHGPVSALILYF